MERIFKIIFDITFIILVISGTIGLIYEYLIFDKSVIPAGIYDVFVIIAYINFGIFIIDLIVMIKKENVLIN